MTKHSILNLCFCLFLICSVSSSVCGIEDQKRFSGVCFWTDDTDELQQQIGVYFDSKNFGLFELIESMAESYDARFEFRELTRIRWSKVFDESVAFGLIKVDSKFEPFFIAQTSKPGLIPKYLNRIENFLKLLDYQPSQTDPKKKDNSAKTQINSLKRLPGFWAIEKDFFCWSTNSDAVTSTLKMTTTIGPCDSLRQDRGFRTIISKTGGKYGGNRFYVSKDFVRCICEQQFGSFTDLAWRKMELNSVLGVGGSVQLNLANSDKQQRMASVNGFILVAQPKSGIFRVLKEANGLSLDLPTPSKMRSYFEVELDGGNLFKEIVKIYDDLHGDNMFDFHAKEFQEKWKLEFSPTEAAQQLSHFAVLTYPENSIHSHSNQNAIFWSVKIKDPNAAENILDQLAMAKSLEMSPIRLKKVSIGDALAWMPSESSVEKYMTQIYDHVENMPDESAKKIVRSAKRFAQNSSCLCQKWYVMEVTKQDIKKMVRTDKESDFQLQDLKKIIKGMCNSADRMPMCVYAVWPQQMSKDFRSTQQALLRKFRQSNIDVENKKGTQIAIKSGPLVVLFFDDRIGYSFCGAVFSKE